MLLEELGKDRLHLASLLGVENRAKLVQRKVQKDLTELEVYDFYTAEVNEMFTENLLVPLLLSESNFFIVLFGQRLNLFSLFLGLFLSLNWCRGFGWGQ